MLADDMGNIRLQIALSDQIMNAVNESAAEWSNDFRIFDVLAAYASGDESKKFASHRILVTLLGRQLAFLFLQMASPESNQRWRILIRSRSISERPAAGKKFRGQRLEDQMERIGVAYYLARKEGLSHSEATTHVQNQLRLNLSESSIRQKLHLFRQSVKRRGYVDRSAPVWARISGANSQPRLLVSDVVRRGRPKKLPKSE